MSLKPYPAYKSSGAAWLGRVPEDWRLVPLWKLFQRMKRTGYPKEQLLSVYRDYGVIQKTSRDDNFNKASDDLDGYQLVEPGDLAINKMKAWQGSVGISDFRGIVSPAYFVYTSRHGEIARFLHYLMRSKEYTAGYLSFSKGIRVNQWDLDPQYHSRMPVVLPSIAEQKAIAMFLDRETANIDRLIAEQDRLIALLGEKRQATISYAVTKGLNPATPMKESGLEWLSEIPEQWTVTKVKYLSALISKGTTPTTVGANFQDSGVRFLKAENIADGAVALEPENFIDHATHELLVRSALREGDVLVVIAGATTGKSAILDNNLTPCNTNQAVSFIRPRCTEVGRYINFWLSTKEVQNVIRIASVQSAQPNLSMEDLGNIPIALPTKFNERADIYDFLDKELSKIKDLIVEANRVIELLKERRIAVISAAVTGKIDVREYKSEQESA